MSTSWETTRVEGSDMGLYVSTPEGEGPFPAIVVIQHQTGVDAFIQDASRRFSQAGYVAVAPVLYHRDPPDCTDDPPTRRARLIDDNIMRDVNATVDYLRSLPNVDSESIGITGFCMGGRVAFLMAAVNPSFKASIPFYGGNTMEPWGDSTAPFDLLGSIKCPVLGFFGEDDPNPSPGDMLEIGQQLKTYGVPHEFHMYSGTGHGYMNFNNPNSYRENSARASWPIALDFLSRQLSRVAVAADD